jgi:hypothetical protein
MNRTAIVTPGSIGALEAYRVVIKDISKVLGDPQIDVAKLFFAVMIQSGLQRFSLPERPSTDIVHSKLLAGRVCEISYGSVESVLHEIRAQVSGSVKPVPLADADQRVVHDITSFLQELYLAAEFGRPVATVIDKPEQKDVRRLLREDVAIVIDGLLSSVQTVDVEAPVARFGIAEADLKSFKSVMASDVFEPYVSSQQLFELAIRPTDGVVESVRARAMTVVQTFPMFTSLKRTTIRALDAIPAVLDATAGKVFGAVAKPFMSALSEALGRDQRLVVYSFFPTWRQIWDGKLDKVRVLVANESNRNAL